MEIKPKILFVDDEINILKSLKRIFLTSGMEVNICDSPFEALKILEKQEFDIVVSDVKMPDMNGIEFLTEVKKKYPEINRVILSGYVERESVLKAIISGVAFDYLTKPWDNDILREKINHILKMRKMIKNDAIRKLINSIEDLPHIPEIANEFVKAVERGDSFDDIAKLIQNDVSLTSKILQIVNSAFYTGEKISSVARAVAIIGLSSLRNIIVTASYYGEEERNLKMERFLRGIVAEMINTNKIFLKLYEQKYQERTPEKYSSIGLVFDIGKVIMLKIFPERFEKIMEEIKKQKGIDFITAEVSLGFEGCTHSEIGGYFLELWNFSKENIEAALFHHKNDECPEELKNILKLLKKANDIYHTFSPLELEEYLKSSHFENGERRDEEVFIMKEV